MSTLSTHRMIANPPATNKMFFITFLLLANIILLQLQSEVTTKMTQVLINDRNGYKKN